jgi:hypothetical protein
MFDVLFYLLFLLLVSDPYFLDVSLFEKIQDYNEEDFEKQEVGKQGK